jgi:hypothetical protein
VGRPGPLLTLGPGAVASPVTWPPGGPAVVRLRLAWPRVTRHMLLTWRALGRPAQPATWAAPNGLGETPGSANGSMGPGAAAVAGEGGGGGTQGVEAEDCWQPALIAADAGGGDEHVRANASALPLGFHLHAWPRGAAAARAGRKEKPEPGGGGGGGGSARAGEEAVFLLLDPRCGYKIGLQPDLFGALWALLLRWDGAGAAARRGCCRGHGLDSRGFCVCVCLRLR